MAIFTTPTAQSSDTTIIGDNGNSTNMNITYPGVNQSNTDLYWDGAPVQFDGDGVRSGLNDDQYDNTAPMVVIQFDEGVSDVSFTITDIDTSSLDSNPWDDQLRVIATDANGDPVEINISLSDPDIVIESDGSAADGYVAQVDGSLDSDGGDATFTIPGPVTNIQIFYEDGDQSSNALGAIGFQMNTFGDVMCFCRGTMIETKTGARPVEELREGDLILTRDNGYQPLRWATSSQIGGRGPQAPIKISAGALGNDTDLMVSPLHKMLISGWRAELCMGEDEVLVMAKALVNGDTIRPAPCQTVEYFHIMFDHHEIVLSNNCWSESFYPGKQALRTLNQAAREDLFNKFPEFAEGISAYGPVNAPVAKAYEGELLAD